ncbi:MAG: hypothetical protein AAF639_31355 [Chloroflexota bacterium]
MSVEAVLTHHLEGFSSGDVDMVMEDYTEDSVLIMPDATFTVMVKKSLNIRHTGQIVQVVADHYRNRL